MSKFWLSVAGFAVATSMSVLHPAGSAEAAPGSTAPPPKCTTYSVNKPWGAAKGKVCWHGQWSEGTVQDKQDDGKCVWVHARFEFDGGGGVSWDSPKACGKGKTVSFKKRTPPMAGSGQFKLVRG